MGRIKLIINGKRKVSKFLYCIKHPFKKIHVGIEIIGYACCKKFKVI